MAHNLNTTDGKTSFVKVGEPAWHGLGTILSDRTGITAEEAITLGGLDYTVKKKKIQVCGGQTIKGYWATERQDTKDVLGVVSDMYEIVQNRDAFKFFDAFMDKSEAVYQTAGVLGKGETVFVTVKLPEDIQIGGETVEGYLLLTNGFTGRDAIKVGISNIAVVCENTLRAALRNIQNSVSILHFKGAQQQLEAASRIMGMQSKYSTAIYDSFNRMTEVKIDDAQLRAYIEQVMKPAKETLNAEGLKEYSKRFIATVDDIMDFTHTHPTQQGAERQGTVWGAYNGISGYFGYLKNYKTQEEKMKDLYFKAGGQKIELAYDHAIQLLS